MNLEYLAGYFDGEGCITVTLYQPPTGKPRYTLLMKIVSGDGDVLACFPALLGGRTYRVNRHKGSTTDLFRWSVNGNKAKEVCRVLAPFLVAKRSQAICVYSFPWQTIQDRENMRVALKALKEERRLGQEKSPERGFAL